MALIWVLRVVLELEDNLNVCKIMFSGNRFNNKIFLLKGNGKNEAYQCITVEEMSIPSL